MKKPNKSDYIHANEYIMDSEQYITHLESQLKGKEEGTIVMPTDEDLDEALFLIISQCLKPHGDGNIGGIPKLKAELTTYIRRLLSQVSTNTVTDEEIIIILSELITKLKKKGDSLVSIKSEELKTTIDKLRLSFKSHKPVDWVSIEAEATKKADDIWKAFGESGIHARGSIYIGAMEMFFWMKKNYCSLFSQVSTNTVTDEKIELVLNTFLGDLDKDGKADKEAIDNAKYNIRQIFSQVSCKTEYGHSKEDMRNLLEDVVNELDLSSEMIAKIISNNINIVQPPISKEDKG